jgi:hypothetical protein
MIGACEDDTACAATTGGLEHVIGADHIGRENVLERRLFRNAGEMNNAIDVVGRQ